MNSFTAVTIRRWIPLLALLMCVGAVAPDATAQSRQRERTTRGKTARTERAEKKTKARSEARAGQSARTERRAPKTETVRSRSRAPQRTERTTRQRAETRQRGAQTTRQRAETRQRTETRQRGTQTARQRTETRERGTRQRAETRQRDTQTARQRGAQTTTRQRAETRQRGTQTTRQRAETRSRSVEPSQASPRGTRADRSPSRARSGRQEGRVEQERNRGTGRSTPRGGRGTDVRQQRGRSGEAGVNRGRATRDQTPPQARPSRREQQRDRGRDRAVTRAPRQDAGARGRRVDRDASRRSVDRYSRARYVERDTWNVRYKRDHRYRPKHWNRRYHKKRRYYHTPVIVRPYIHVDIHWPWVHRHRHGWRPRYQYRQVIYVDAGWGSRHQRRSRIDVRTHYYHELRQATRNRAEVDIYIERIELYENDRYLGEIRHIPQQLGRIRATVYRDGRVHFDRDVFVVGDTYAGFELISTRYYDGFLLDAYRPQHGVRVGVVDLRRGRVVPASHSYLFNPHDFNGYVPVSLLPEDRGWLLDYGDASFSAGYYDADPYYYGGYNAYGDEYDDPYYGDDYYEEDYYEDDRGRPYYSVRSTVAEANFNIEPMSKTYDRRYTTSFGASVHLKRETSFVRTK